MPANRTPFPDPPALPARNASLCGGQARLVCSCGEACLLCCGLCSCCYWQEHRSRRRFAGHRDQVLERDGRRCCGCGSLNKLAVHHRLPGVHQPRFLITLCAACHARIHRLRAMRRGLRTGAPSPLGGAASPRSSCSSFGRLPYELCGCHSTTQCGHPASAARGLRQY